MDYTIYYLQTNDGVRTIELEEEPINMEDFLNDLVSGGFEDFKLYNNLCNAGLCGLVGEAEAGEVTVY